MVTTTFSADSPVGAILRHLQRHGQATIRDLEGVLGTSTTAVREHLAHLQVEGLVASSTHRHGPGRPRMVYALTTKAQSLAPKQYDQLIVMLLHELSTTEGSDVAQRLLERVSQRLASEYADQMHGTDVATRLSELQTMLEARGVPADVATSGDGIRFFACPYYDVIHQHPEVCSMERRMLEYVIGESVELESSIREGSHTCSFVVREA